ncbi:MAG: Rossmann-like and DUF2520 domain-containing protein [Longimicrobiales bacterium]
MSESVVVIGPGRVGLALGAALREAGATETLTFYGRGLEPPPHPLFEPGGGAGYRRGPYPVPDGTTAVILAVPDAALATVAFELAAAGEAPRGCAALHCSGALSSEVLTPLLARGYAIGSLHPLQSIADPWGGSDRLFGSAFAVSGEPAAVGAARRLVDALGGRVLLIPPMVRPVYHAAASMASNHLIALVAASVRLLGEAGVDEEQAVSAVLPLMRGTLDNLEHLGVGAALTGPIARGDADTVRLHLARLSPGDRALYSALGRETLRLARAAGLDPARADELDSLLAGS